MTKLRIAIAGLITAIAAAQGAWGADLGGGPAPYREPFARGFTWSGLYVGTHVGYGWSDSDWQNLGVTVLNNSGFGGVAGVQLGYNWQAGKVVFGVESDYSGSWTGGTSSCPNPFYNCGHDINWMASLRGRLGIAVNDNRTLLYGTAGAAWADVTWSSRDVFLGQPFGSDFSKTQRGWVAGGGIEHMLSHNMSARIEYLYYGFDGPTAPAGTLGALPTKLDLSQQVVRFGLNLKF